MQDLNIADKRKDYVGRKRRDPRNQVGSVSFLLNLTFTMDLKETIWNACMEFI